MDGNRSADSDISGVDQGNGLAGSWMRGGTAIYGLGEAPLDAGQVAGQPRRDPGPPAASQYLAAQQRKPPVHPAEPGEQPRDGLSPDPAVAAAASGLNRGPAAPEDQREQIGRASPGGGVVVLV